VLLAEA
jgi:hypothetical protein